jgi:hypothetical protein
MTVLRRFYWHFYGGIIVVLLGAMLIPFSVMLQEWWLVGCAVTATVGGLWCVHRAGIIRDEL